jgi:hypothetical protein
MAGPTSSVEEPKDGGWYRALPEVSGTATAADDSSTSKIKEVKVRIKDVTSDTYWNGKNWQGGVDDWLDTNLTSEGTSQYWVKSQGLPTWESCKQYSITSRATDRSNVSENPGEGNTFFFDSKGPTSNISMPIANQSYCVLEELSGLARDGEGCSGVQKVEISIQDSDDRYWGGQAWVEAKTLLPTEVVPDGEAATWTKSDELPVWVPDTKYTIRSIATDRAGNAQTSEVSGSFMFTEKCSAQLPLVMRNYPSWIQAMGTGGRLVYSLAVCPAEALTMYAGTEQHGVLRKDRNNPKWVPTGLQVELVRDVAVHPTDCSIAYATTWGQGVQKTDNAGGIWSRKDTGLGDEYLYSLAIDPSKPDTIFAGTSGQGAFRSRNGGDSWLSVGLIGRAVTALAIDPNPETDVVYAGTWGDGIYKSEDAGDNWSKLEGYQGDSHIYALAVDPTKAETVYAGTLQDGVYRTEDGGSKWARDGLAGWVVYSVAVDEDGVAYAGTDGAQHGSPVYRRSQAAWEPVLPSLKRSLTVRGIAFSDSVVLAGTTDGIWWYEPE